MSSNTFGVKLSALKTLILLYDCSNSSAKAGSSSNEFAQYLGLGLEPSKLLILVFNLWCISTSNLTNSSLYARICIWSFVTRCTVPHVITVPFCISILQDISLPVDLAIPNHLSGWDRPILALSLYQTLS